ncbi:MAG: helix-turn-helix domain-containing protein [Oscillospiraceae bacterium]
MEYISVKEAAERWNVSARRVNKYCEDRRIPGLLRFGRVWLIPTAAEKPKDPRCGKKIGGDGVGAR